jgi:hypothetical protein
MIFGIIVKFHGHVGNYRFGDFYTQRKSYMDTMVPFQFCTPNIMWPARECMHVFKIRMELKIHYTAKICKHLYGGSYSRVLKVRPLPTDFRVL